MRIGNAKGTPPPAESRKPPVASCGHPSMCVFTAPFCLPYPKAQAGSPGEGEDPWPWGGWAPQHSLNSTLNCTSMPTTAEGAPGGPPRPTPTPAAAWADMEPPLCPGAFTNVSSHQVTRPCGPGPELSPGGRYAACPQGTGASACHPAAGRGQAQYRGAASAGPTGGTGEGTWAEGARDGWRGAGPGLRPGVAGCLRPQKVFAPHASPLLRTPADASRRVLWASREGQGASPGRG